LQGKVQEGNHLLVDARDGELIFTVVTPVMDAHAEPEGVRPVT
jgi:hypothetical protein